MLINTSKNACLTSQLQGGSTHQNLGTSLMLNFVQHSWLWKLGHGPVALWMWECFRKYHHDLATNSTGIYLHVKNSDEFDVGLCATFFYFWNLVTVKLPCELDNVTGDICFTSQLCRNVLHFIFMTVLSVTIVTFQTNLTFMKANWKPMLHLNVKKMYWIELNSLIKYHWLVSHLLQLRI